MLDLSAVESDSSGLGAVIALRKLLPEGRRMQLRGLTRMLPGVRLTRMDRVFEFAAPEDGGEGP